MNDDAIVNKTEKNKKKLLMFYACLESVVIN